MREAINLVAWLRAHDLALGDLRQDPVDAWLADGRTTRRNVRPFLAWLARTEGVKSIAPLPIPSGPIGPYLSGLGICSVKM